MLLAVCGWGVYLIVLITYLQSTVLSFEHKWMPKDIIKSKDVDEDFHQVFTGYKKHVDHFRFLLQEGNFMLIGGRNEVYNISLMTLKEDEDRRLTWKPKMSDENLCNSKSDPKYQSKCQNFIQVLGKMDDGKLYVCGTNAFKPKCRIYEYKEANYPVQVPEYVSSHEELGTGKSPHDPEHNSTAIYSGGKLYSATVADFLGRDPLIMMSENQIILRTAQHDSNMLSEPHFVSSIEIDDMIYIFMRENAVENINCGKATFSRVARICKTDKGGQYEEGVWTSFFKARLNCSLPGDIPFPFNELQATSSFSPGNYMPTRDNRNRTQMFYGVFNTPDNSIQGSAVCAFSLDDVNKAFEGPFKGQLTAQHNWLSVVDQTPKPHPAQECVNDSKTLPDNTLRFIREHPLMDTAIAPRGGSPVLMQTATQGRFTAIAIDYQVLAGDRKYYDIMFIGTSEGRVLKSINSGSEGPVKSVVIEDLQVLGEGEAIKELKIFKNGVDAKLIVISKENIKAIPLQRCSRRKSCGDCVAIQDPYCYWLKDQCTTHTSRGLQDLKHGDRSKCPDGGIDVGIVEEEIVTTEEPVIIETPSCPVCSCNCNQSESDTDLATANSSEQTADGPLRPLPDPEDNGVDIEGPPWTQPCEPQFNAATSKDQIYTASTLAIASVISIVVAALIGFVIGYRVSLCRNQARDTEQVINYEQSFGSLRKHSNRHSSINESNYYTDPTVQKQYKNNIQQSNILVSNNIANKNPNLPNGSIESKTMTPKQASKTYL